MSIIFSVSDTSFPIWAYPVIAVGAAAGVAVIVIIIIICICIKCQTGGMSPPKN